MNQKELKQTIADLFIHILLKKLLVYNHNAYPEIVGGFRIFDENINISKTNGESQGIYGYCETLLDNGETQECGSSVDWPVTLLNFSHADLFKLIGVIEYRLEEIVAGRMGFDISNKVYKSLVEKLNK